MLELLAGVASLAAGSRLGLGADGPALALDVKTVETVDAVLKAELLKALIKRAKRRRVAPREGVREVNVQARKR